MQITFNLSNLLAGARNPLQVMIFKNWWPFSFLEQQISLPVLLLGLVVFTIILLSGS